MPSWLRQPGTPSGGAPTLEPTTLGSSAPSFGSADAGKGASGGGVYPIDISTPQGVLNSAGNAAQQSTDLLSGLSRFIGQTPIGAVAQGLFGKDNGSLLGGTPVGDVARFVGGIPGGVGDTIKNAVGAVANAPIGAVIPGAQQNLDKQYASMPDSPEKRANDAAIANDPWGGDHLKTQFIAAAMAAEDASGVTNPSLAPELRLKPIATLGDGIGEMFGFLSLTARPVERWFAGTGFVRMDGMDRLQEIDQVANGMSFTGGGQAGLTPVEQIAWARWKQGVDNGGWSAAQALDFLSSHGAGFSHNPIAEIGGEVVLDPQFFGSLGAGAIEKLGLQVGKVATTAEDVALGVGRIARTEAATGIARAIAPAFTIAKEEQAIASVVHVVRNIVDPLHAISGAASGVAHLVRGDATVDLLSDVVTHAAVFANGEGSMFVAMHYLKGLAKDASIYERAKLAFSTYAGNIARRVAAREYRSGVLNKAFSDRRWGDRLIQTPINEVVDNIVGHADKTLIGKVQAEALMVKKDTWLAEDIKDLAARVGTQYGGDVAKHEKVFTQLANEGHVDVLNALHQITYGEYTQDLNAAYEAVVKRIGVDAAEEAKVHRIVLMNKHTLSDLGAQGVLDDVKAVAVSDEAAAKAAGFATVKDATLASKAEILRAAQKQYPSLAYLRLAPETLEKDIAIFEARLRQLLKDRHIPHQITHGESATLPDEYAALEAKMKGQFNFAYDVDEDLKWGLEADPTTGRYIGEWEPYVGHVSATASSYRGSFALEHNFAGMPLLQKAAEKFLDPMEAAARTLGKQVMAKEVTENARDRFAVRAVERFGIPEKNAKELFQSVINQAQLHQVAARGLHKTEMFAEAVNIIPQEIYQKGLFRENELFALITEAYEGDLRYVGLTQAFTGAVKTRFAKLPGAPEYLGQVSEKLYPMLRFGRNIIFQSQQRIEAVVLPAQRGVMTAFGTKMNDVDRMAAAIDRRLAETGLARMGDIDQVEWAAVQMAGRDAEAALGRFADQSRFRQMLDVKGATRLNQLRTMQQNWGKELRKVFSADGSWDNWVTEYSNQAKHVVSDDEAATRYIYEQMFGGADVNVPRLLEPGDHSSQFLNAINQQNWLSPSHIGQLQSLQMDEMIRNIELKTAGGLPIRTAEEMGAALRSKIPERQIPWSQVEDALVHHAHPDYVARFKRVMDFDYNTFWQQVADKYNMPAELVGKYERFYANAAAARGMQPAEYLSQIFEPTIVSGAKPILAESLSNVDEAGKMLNTLTARASGRGTEEQFVSQMTDVFFKHLDPSMQDALAEQYVSEIGGHLQEVAHEVGTRTVAGRSAVAATRAYGTYGEETRKAFARQVLDRIQGKPVTADLASPADLTNPFVLEATSPWEFKPYLLNQRYHNESGEAIRVRIDTPRTLGDRLLASDERHPILATIAWQRTHLPNLHTPTFEIMRPTDAGFAEALGGFKGPGNAWAVTIDGRAIRLNSEVFDSQEGSYWVQQQVKDAAQRAATGGVGGNAVPSAEGTLNHEIAHAVDGQLTVHFISAAKTGGRAPLKTTGHAYRAFRQVYLAHLDEQYGKGVALTSMLDDIAAHPAEEAALMERYRDAGAFIPKEIDSLVTQWRQAFARDMRLTAVSGAPFSGTSSLLRTKIAHRYFPSHPSLRSMKNPEEAMAELGSLAFTPGAVIPQQSRKWVEAYLDNLELDGVYVRKAKFSMTHQEVNELAAKNGRPLVTPPINPHVEAATQHFAQWGKQTLEGGLVGGDSEAAALLKRTTGIPTEHAAPFNRTEQLMQEQMSGALKRSANDAFKLLYFSQSRSVFERSLNHPFFGLYPASYMWGKIMPELVKFIAKTPFGLNTGALAYALNDVQRAIAVQREFNPDFEKFMAKADKSAIINFLGYLLPALPTDIPSVAPAWARNLAEQANANQARADAGQPQREIDLGAAFGKSLDFLDYQRQVRILERPLKELGDIVNPNATIAAQGPMAPAVKPDTSGGTLGTGLAPVLSSEMVQLQEVLTR